MPSWGTSPLGILRWTGLPGCQCALRVVSSGVIDEARAEEHRERVHGSPPGVVFPRCRFAAMLPSAT